MENQAAVERIEAEMPPISLEASLRGKRVLRKALGFHWPVPTEGRQLADGYVRLVEKSILEYQAAREKLIAFLVDGLVDDYYRAQDHFESSIHSLHRAIELLDRLRRRGFSRADGTAFIPRPRDLEVLRDAEGGVRSTVRNLRDRAEHVDEDIVNGRIPPEADVAIQLRWDRATICGLELLYVDVVRCVEQLHHFAALLSRLELSVST